VSVSRPAPRSLASALEELAAELTPASTLARVQACWQDAVGAQIAAVARPLGERDGTLTVGCESSVWAAELDLLAEELLARLNSALGDRLLHKLRCRAG
jgi:predicted nucleic acid-binding Zn ribbon protein